jgi:hypothetical protein
MKQQRERRGGMLGFGGGRNGGGGESRYRGVRQAGREIGPKMIDLE